MSMRALGCMHRSMPKLIFFFSGGMPMRSLISVAVKKKWLLLCVLAAAQGSLAFGSTSPVSSLMRAVQVGDSYKVARLLRNIPVDAVDSAGRTALHHAILHTKASDRESMTLLLLLKGASINARDASGKTPYEYYLDRLEKPIPDAYEDRDSIVLIRNYQDAVNRIFSLKNNETGKIPYQVMEDFHNLTGLLKDRDLSGYLYKGNLPSYEDIGYPFPKNKKVDE